MATVTVNYNRPGDTAELINSIKKSDLSESVLLVIDNGSTDNSLDILRKSFPNINIVETGRNLGFASGYNFGMNSALETDAEAILIINNDTLVPPSFLLPLLKTLESSPSVGAVSPKTYQADGKHIWWAGGKIDLSFGRLINIGAGKLDSDQFNKIVECDYLSGVCILFKREVLEKVGLFDERFVHTCEDDDIAIRIRKAGYKLLMVPESKLIHKVSQTSGGEYSSFHLYSLEKYRLLLMKKWGYWQGLLTLIKLGPLFIRRLGGAFIRGHGLTSALAMLRGWRDGIFYEKSA